MGESMALHDLSAPPIEHRNEIGVPSEIDGYQRSCLSSSTELTLHRGQRKDRSWHSNRGAINHVVWKTEIGGRSLVLRTPGTVSRLTRERGFR
jgi:hypothetical protein